MSYLLDQLAYWRARVGSRSSYDLMRDVLVVDGRGGGGGGKGGGRDYRWEDERLLRARRQSYTRSDEYVDPVVRSLRRDQSLLMSNHPSTLNKSLHTIQPIHPPLNSHNSHIPKSKSRLSTQLSQSSIAYPYTYTEYSIMKETQQKRRRMEEEWLQKEIERIREENGKGGNINSGARRRGNVHKADGIKEGNAFVEDDLKQAEEDQEIAEDEQNQIQHCELKAQCEVDGSIATKRSMCSNSRRPAYSSLLVFTTSTLQPTPQPNNKYTPLQQNPYTLSSATNNNHNQHNPHSRVQYQSHSQSYQISMRPSDHGYPIFSPLKVHKHLPHNENQYMYSNVDSKKQAKHSRALVERKENDYYYTTTVRRDDEEGEGKKMLTKSYDHHTFVQRKAFYQHKRNEDVPPLVRNPEVAPYYQPKAPYTHPHHYQHHQHQHQQPTTQSLANSLKVQLQILKQQLDDKNKRVVDLEIELLELKCSIFDKTHEKKGGSVATQTEQEDDEGGDGGRQEREIELLDASTQTMALHKRVLRMSHVTVSLQLQTAKPTRRPIKFLQTELQKQHAIRKKLQQKLHIQQQAMNNFLQDIDIYQTKNKQLQHKVKTLQAEKSSSAIKQQ